MGDKKMMRKSLDARLALLLGYELVRVRWWESRKVRGFEQVKRGNWKGYWNHSSFVKWLRIFDDDMIVGDYYVDPKRRKVVCEVRDWRPTKNMDQAMAIAKQLKIALVPVDRNGGVWWAAAVIESTAIEGNAYALCPADDTESSAIEPAVAISLSAYQLLAKGNGQ